MPAIRVKRLLALLLAPLAALTASITPLTAQAAPAATPQFYLSLGDSLAQGVQPNATGQSVQTNQGYADQLFRIEQFQFSHLHLAKLGCPGETTTTFLAGGPFCAYSPTPQMQQALAFLAAHNGHVAFITIDIGGNDVDNCLVGGTISLACIGAGFASISQNLPVILAQLKAAAPGVPIIGMNLYDPFLALWLQGPQGQALANASLQLAVALNSLFAQVYGAFSVPVADVAGAFLTTNMTLIGGVPLDVRVICALTWMCVPPPVGPNIHANALGYAVIAFQFARQL